MRASQSTTSTPLRSKPRIAILDYGMGNRASVAKALEHVGAEVVVSSSADELRRAAGLVVIGVGAFPEGMRRLAPLKELLSSRLREEGTPVLGICLGMQLLFDGSEEHEGSRGLGFMEGEVRRLDAGGERLPHIGWNRVQWEKPSRLLEGLPNGCHFYHAHSYAAQPADESTVLGTTCYGETFVSAVEQGQLFGVQFHPEKSGAYGLKLLENFVRICANDGLKSWPETTASSSKGRGVCKRVIPCLDVDGGRVVKGTGFVDLKDAGDPVELAEFYDEEGADEIVFLDITATHEKRKSIIELARRTASNVFVPITIGGGIRTVEDAQAVLDAGADNVSVNSAAVANPELIGKLTRVLAAQNLILAVDAKRRVDDHGWEVYVAGGRKTTGRGAVEWACEGVERGAGQILLTSMDRDGVQGGYDIELIRAVSEAVSVPVIASGGAGNPEHLADALAAGADAVLCASIFHYGHYRVCDVKDYLAQRGFDVTPSIPLWHPNERA